ncbi:substrate-binding domain-containing protein [Phytoactinopolyspora mesophila]|uniref:DeoR family transcriptional regulator n=1 Tax=Phytoactinopolyspora mesophila TaxID=2650750 RepID=A0A7K3LZD5_9ACTN|nr:substrate-binding domain-containing protein [Phytoactinopolyspora mesophila]NDL56052.1 DeoR family transcriptional regulator [Phytoactinopolyspora mesophila]
MLAAHRRELILDAVRSRGSVRLRDLIDELGVSMATVRRDVTDLAERGLVARTHGAISPVHSANGDHSPPAPRAHSRPAPTDSALPGAGLTIGMLVPSATYYYPEVIRGARAAGADLGAHLVLGISHYNPEADRSRIDELLAGDVDGLIITVSDQLASTNATADWLAALPVPAVLVERPAELGTGLEHLDSVSSDHAYGACLGVRHLANLGHRSITLVTRRDSPNRALVERGYQAGIREMGIGPLPAVTTPHPEVNPAEFDEAISGVVADVTQRQVSAVLVHNDQDAIVMIQRLHASGVRVPDDVAIVAYDDEVAAIIDTPLTAIAPPKHAVGRAAVELLIARLAHVDERPVQHLSMLPELRIRQSCGATVASLTDS